jgi:hypothetical protein
LKGFIANKKASSEKWEERKHWEKEEHINKYLDVQKKEAPN